MYPLSLHTLGAGNDWQYLYLAHLLAAAENIYRIRPIKCNRQQVLKLSSLI